MGKKGTLFLDINVLPDNTTLDEWMLEIDNGVLRYKGSKIKKEELCKVLKNYSFGTYDLKFIDVDEEVENAIKDESNSSKGFL